MGGFVIADIQEADLAAVADFLHRTVTAQTTAPAGDGSGLLAGLQWRLQNPARPATIPLGQCVRADDGRIVGTNIVFPIPFRLGERRLVGLCSANFFVDPPARIQGFFAFRRYLATPGVDFWYATSSNENSGALWQKLGGAAVAGSEAEWFLPLQLAPLAEEMALRKTSSRLLSKAAGAMGKLITPFFRPRRAASSLRLRPSQDWERLAALAAQCRNPLVLTCERSAEHLRWRYQFPGQTVYEMTDAQGTSGWLAVCPGRRGKRFQIRTCTVLDLVWPNKELDARAFLSALAEQQASMADVLVFQGRIATACQTSGLRLWTNPHGYFRTYILGNAGSDRPLAEIVDLVPADGD